MPARTASSSFIVRLLVPLKMIWSDEADPEGLEELAAGYCLDVDARFEHYFENPSLSLPSMHSKT